MTFEPKMSGIRVTDYDIKPIFTNGTISLADINEKITKQETMNWILDNMRFLKSDGGWCAFLDNDTILKITILEKYPDYEQEMINKIGDNWINHYIRFNH